MATATTPRNKSNEEYKERWNESREPPIFRRSITKEELDMFKIVLAKSYKLGPGEERFIKHEFQNIKIVDDSDLNDTYKFTDRKSHEQDQECERRKFGTTDVDFMWLVFKMFVERAHGPNEPARQEWREIYKIKIMMPEGAREKALALKHQRANMSNIMGTMALNPADAFGGFQGSNQSMGGQNAYGQCRPARHDMPMVEEIVSMHPPALMALPAPPTSGPPSGDLPKPVMRTGVKRTKGKIIV